LDKIIAMKAKATVRKKPREPVRTSTRILNAATREFCAKGFAGARMEGIAKRAGVSKQLILHHFKSKENLYNEVHNLLRSPAFQSLELEDYLSSPPSELLADRFLRRTESLEYQRFLTWEAAGVRNRPLPGEKDRQHHVDLRSRSIRLLQEAGHLPADMDYKMLHLAVVALASYPLSFTEITRLIAGRNCTDPKFQEDWAKFLRQLGQVLTTTARPRAGKKQAQPA
jgi:AcrR family transcriptional regulator